eukprot:m.92668 g.92668  ORF g.92668 m.92668 type:complete len:98 (-) comp12362_c3_seq2:317-610(-)
MGDRQSAFPKNYQPTAAEKSVLAECRKDSNIRGLLTGSVAMFFSSAFVRRRGIKPFSFKGFFTLFGLPAAGSSSLSFVSYSCLQLQPVFVWWCSTDK